MRLQSFFKESQSSLASSAYGQALSKSRSVSQETSQGQLYSNAPIFPQDSFLQRSVSQPVQPQAAYYINAKHVSIGGGYVPPGNTGGNNSTPPQDQYFMMEQMKEAMSRSNLLSVRVVHF